MFRMNLLFAAAALFVGFASHLAAQDEQPAADQALPVGGILEGITNGIGGAIQIEAVTDDGDGPVRVFSIGTGGPTATLGLGAPQPMSLLQMSQIQKELELVDDQQEQIDKIRGDLQSKLVERMRERTKGGLRLDRESMEKWTAEMQQLRDEAQQQVDDVLLPQQRDRLKQLAWHVEMKNSGTQEALLEGKLAEELGLTDKQKEHLREKAAEIEAKMKAEIARVQAKARADLFDELTPAQQKKLEDLLGEEFDYQPTDWRSRIRQMRRTARP